MNLGGRPRAPVGRSQSCISLPTPLVALKKKYKNLIPDFSAYIATNFELYLVQRLKIEEEATDGDPELIADIRATLGETMQEKRDRKAIGAALATLREQYATEILKNTESSRREITLREALAEALPTTGDMYGVMDNLENEAPIVQARVARACGETPTATEILRYCRERITEELNRDERGARA